MNQNWVYPLAMGLLWGLLFFQVYSLSKWQQSFMEGMERKAERVERNATAAGATPAQAQAISSAVSEVKYEVTMYMGEVSWTLISVNFAMAVIVLVAGKKNIL